MDPLQRLSKGTNTNSSSAPKTGSTLSSDKPKKKSKINSSPYIKELRGVLLLGLVTAGVVGAGYHYLTDEVGEFYYGHLTEESKLISSAHTNILQQQSVIAGYNNTIVELQSEVDAKRESANEASLLKTPLQQGFYFTAYLDAITAKHKVTIEELEVQLEKEGVGGQVISLVEAVQNVDYALLPVKVKFTGKYDDIVAVFNDIYTKRIIYDRDLALVNNYDGTVTVDTLITFNDIVPEKLDAYGNPLPQQEQPVSGEQAGIVDPVTGMPIVPSPTDVSGGDSMIDPATDPTALTAQPQAQGEVVQ